MSQIGKSIDLYLMDGTTSGRCQASLSNWNASVFKISRNDLKKCSDLPELYTPGVYFLFGFVDDDKKPFVYIGEGDDVLTRLTQPHRFESDSVYWIEAVIFVTPDGTLEKGRIKYLENRFYNIAKEAGKYLIKNGNTPKQSPVQKKIRDMLEVFIENAVIVMTALGYKVFEPQPSKDSDDSGKEDLLYFTRNQEKAYGKIDDGRFWVLKGSHINPEMASYLPIGVKNAREDYGNSIGKDNILKENIPFGSPSYAASFVCGKSSNGLVEWKNKDGITLKALNGEETDVAKTDKRKKSASTKVTFDPDGKIKLKLAKRLDAYAYMVNENEMLVLKGSQFSAEEVKSCSECIRNKRKMLLDEGKVVNGVFVEDVLFSSPSTAAGCICGRSLNGRELWKTEEGKSLKELQIN